MENFVGTWKKTGSENLDNFLKASGVSDAQLQILNEKANNLCEEISVSGQVVTIIKQSSSNSGKQTKTGTLGKEFDFTLPNGQSQKIVFRLEGGDFVEEISGNGPHRIVRKIEGNTMIQTMTKNGETATITFTKM